MLSFRGVHQMKTKHAWNLQPATSAQHALDSTWPSTHDPNCNSQELHRKWQQKKKQKAVHFTFWYIFSELDISMITWQSLLGRQVTCCPTSLKLALGAWPSDSKKSDPERRCWKIFRSAQRSNSSYLKGKNPKRELKILGSTDINLFMEEHLSFFNVSVKSFWMCWQLCLRFQLWRISHHLGLQIGLAVQIGCLNVHLVLCAGMVIQQRKNRSFIGARNEDVSSW